MSILAKYNAAMEAKDEAAMNEILHDDYKFTMHASGNVLGKADVIKWAMSGDIKRDKIRVIFENDEIGVEHAFVSFNDGNTEAVMAVFKYQDGKIFLLKRVQLRYLNNYIYFARFHLILLNESRNILWLFNPSSFAWSNFK